MTETLDRYHLRARVQPALLGAVPVGWTVAALALGDDQWFRAVATLVASTGVMYLIAQAVRDRGRRLETELWATWGGPPTSHLLSWEGGAPVEQVRQHHRNLKRLLGDDRIVSPELEATEAERAREMVEHYVRHLRERTRDQTQYPVVFAENVAYGFRRNTLGLRPLGFAVSAVCFLVSIIFAARATAAHWDRLGILWAVTGLNLGALLAWISVVTPSWVHRQATNYAHALLNAAEALEPIGRRS